MTEDETKPYAFNGQQYATELESVEAAYDFCQDQLAKMLAPRSPETAKIILQKFVEMAALKVRLASGLNIMLSTSPEGQREPITGEQT